MGSLLPQPGILFLTAYWSGRFYAPANRFSGSSQLARYSFYPHPQGRLLNWSKAEYVHPLSHCQLLQEDLSSVVETDRVAIAVGISAQLGKGYLFFVTDTELLLQVLWNISQH